MFFGSNTRNMFFGSSTQNTLFDSNTRKGPWSHCPFPSVRTKEQVRVPRRRVYFWDDEMTDYDALCQTIVNILSVIDDWVWEQDEGETYPMIYSKVDGEKTMIASIIDIYDTMSDMYFTVIDIDESEDEECDSVS